MRVDHSDPFMVQEAMMRGIRKTEKNIADWRGEWTPEELEQAQKALASMNRSLRSLDGVGVLHLDLEFRKARRKMSWWKRRAFDREEDAWKKELRARLIREAAEIEDLTL